MHCLTKLVRTMTGYKNIIICTLIINGISAQQLENKEVACDPIATAQQENLKKSYIEIQSEMDNALATNNMELISNVLNKISKSNYTLFENKLIEIFQNKHRSNKGENDMVCAKIIITLGDIGGDKTRSVLKDIISQNKLTTITEAALISAKKNCSTDLLAEISSYASKLEAKIKSNSFEKKDTDQKPLISPEHTLLLAKSIIGE